MIYTDNIDSGGSSGNALANLQITAPGFQFLLEEVNKQLWDLLLEYLRSSSVGCFLQIDDRELIDSSRILSKFWDSYSCLVRWN